MIDAFFQKEKLRIYTYAVKAYPMRVGAKCGVVGPIESVIPSAFAKAGDNLKCFECSFPLCSGIWKLLRSFVLSFLKSFILQ